MNEKGTIYKSAILSRTLLIFIQYVSNVIIPDHAADAYIYPKYEENGVLDKIISHVVGGFVRWDAQHFMHIAKYGYTYEHTLAFFPFCPYLVRCIAVPISYVLPFLNLDSLTLLTFIVVNTFCFVQSALCLYELSLCIVNKEVAYKASIIFCWNPASIFFSAPYTEAVFCYLTFKSMLNCVLLYKKFCDIHSHLKVKDLTYIVPISLSALTRSNGVLNVGFLLYSLVCLFLHRVNAQKQIFNKVITWCKFMFLIICVIGLSLLPFILFQIYSYQMFCKDFQVELPPIVLTHKDVKNFVLPGTFSQHNQSWCFNKIPLAYSYIQNHYWKVGFLQYYELKQIPNFLLASPIIFVLLKGAFIFFKQYDKNILLKIFNFDLLQKSVDKKCKCSPVMFVYVVHATALTVFCVLNVHVQVTTRMLCSASPVLYWFAAYKLGNLYKDSLLKRVFSEDCDKTEFAIICYFLSYFVIGTITFCNFLPWT